MGTIVIEQMTRAGSAAQPDQPLPKLDKGLVRSEDTTTSTTPESVTLGTATRILSLYAVEKHRFSVNGDTTTNYFTVNAGERRDVGVDGGETLSYRLDA